MHSDWFIEGANVLVEIYSDCVEVISPGEPPHSMSPTDLGSKSFDAIV